jgi:hypothetical protein
MRNKSIPQTEKPHHLFVSIWSDRSYADVHHVDSGIFEALKISSSKCLGIREPGRALVALEGSQHSKQCEGVKHVDDRAALNQIDRVGGVFGRIFCEELKPTAVDHRRGDSRRGNTNQALQGLAACYHAWAQYDNLCRHWQRRDA